jgi:hypothetical protein
MLFRYTIITTLLLSSFLCISMENSTATKPFKLMSLAAFERMLPKKHMRFKAEAYKHINREFEEIWGYCIPDNVIKETITENNIIIKSTYKLVSDNFLKEKKENVTYEIQPTWNIHPLLTVDVSQVNSFESLDDLKAKIKIKESDIAPLRSHNKNLKQEILHINKYLASKIKNRKKNSTTAQNKSNQNIVYQSGISYDDKKDALLYLLNDYQAKTTSNLLCKMKSECITEEVTSVGGHTKNNISWLYTLNNNKLRFNAS